MENDDQVTLRVARGRTIQGPGRQVWHEGELFTSTRDEADRFVALGFLVNDTVPHTRPTYDEVVQSSRPIVEQVGIINNVRVQGPAYEGPAGRLGNAA